MFTIIQWRRLVYKAHDYVYSSASDYADEKGLLDGIVVFRQYGPVGKEHNAIAHQRATIGNRRVNLNNVQVAMAGTDRLYYAVAVEKIRED